MINILMSGNYCVADGILLAALSIAKHTTQPVSLYILTASLTEHNPSFMPLTDGQMAVVDEILKQKSVDSAVRLIDATDLFREKMSGSVNIANHYTPFAFLRLLAPYLDLPDKILYLDIDVLARADLSELYAVDVDGLELAAAKDYHGQFFIRPSYFNTGVLLLNLGEIRKTGLFDKAIALCNSRRMIMPDQSALNKFATKKKYISPRYNRQRHPKQDTVIQHFIRKFVFFPYPHIVCVKPWEIERVHKKYKIFEYDDIFEQYLRLKPRLEDKNV